MSHWYPPGNLICELFASSGYQTPFLHTTQYTSQSLQTLLATTPDGMTLTEAVAALRHRQGHDVPRGNIRALVYKVGFVQRDNRGSATADPNAAARPLRPA